MPEVLTTASDLRCSHGGSLVITASQDKFTVDGQSVLLLSDIAGATISKCPIKQTNSTKPCQKVATVAAGLSTRLQVGTESVMLATAQGLTDGLPTPQTWSVKAVNQNKLEAR